MSIIDPLAIVNNNNIGMLTQQAQQPVQQQATPPTGMLAQEETTPGITWEQLEEQRLAGNPYSVDSDFFESDKAARDKDAMDLRFEYNIGEDLERQEVRGGAPQYVSSPLGTYRAGDKGNFQTAIDQGTVQRLKEQGLEPVYKQNEYKGYKYSPSEGTYVYYDNTPSNWDKYSGALVKTAIMGVATAGIGSALAGSAAVSGLAGGNSMIAAGIGKGIAAGGMTAMQGGDGGDILKSAVMGGIGGAAGESTKLLANAEHMATLSESAASGLQATSDLLNTTNTILKTAEAVDNKDILGVVQGGLQLSGLPSIGKFTSDTLMENFPDSTIVMKHSDSIATGIIKASDKVLQGATPEKALQAGIMSYFKDGGGLALGEFDIDLDSADFGLPESLQPIIDAFRAGIDAIDENVVKPVLDTVNEVAEGADQFVRDLPGEIEDVEGAIEAVNEPVDKLIRAIPGTKEDAQDAGDWLVDKGKDALEGLAGILLGGSSGGTGNTQQAPKDEYVDLTNITLNPAKMTKGFEYESLSNPYLRG